MPGLLPAPGPLKGIDTAGEKHPAPVQGEASICQGCGGHSRPWRGAGEDASEMGVHLIKRVHTAAEAACCGKCPLCRKRGDSVWIWTNSRNETDCAWPCGG